MGAELLYLLSQRDMFQTWITYGKFVEVLAFIMIGAAVYGIAALVFGAIRPSDLKAMLRRKAA